MACASNSMISASSCAFTAQMFMRRPGRDRGSKLFSVRASASDEAECNTEECAPDKEVGKVSMDWLANEKTKVVGTYPPRKPGWTGYVEKDTAGQTNIYSVEPAVYIAESAISSGTSGTSSDGAENTAAIAAGLALISIAVASSILLQVGKNSPEVQTVEYSGPPLSYYINKFKPVEIVEAAVAPAPEPSSTVEASVPPAPEPTSSTVEASVLPAPEPTSSTVEASVLPAPEPTSSTVEASVLPAPEPTSSTVEASVLPAPEPTSSTVEVSVLPESESSGTVEASVPLSPDGVQS